MFRKKEKTLYFLQLTLVKKITDATLNLITLLMRNKVIRSNNHLLIFTKVKK